MNYKRIFFALALLAATILIGYGLWRAFRATAPTVPVPTAPATPPGQLPPSGFRPPPGTVALPSTPGGPPTSATEGQPTPPEIFRPAPVEQISRAPTLFPSLSTTGDLRYHNSADGKFYRLKPDGKISELDSPVFYNVEKVTWAKNRDLAVLEYPDSSKIVYDFERQSQVTLPRHWQEFSWSPDGRQLAGKSMGLAPENRWLITTQADGSGTRLIEPLGDKADRVIVSWSPSRQVVAFSQTGQPQGADRREVLLLGQNNENFRSIIVEGLDFVPQWSPSGQQLLYSVDSARSSFRPELWIADAYGDAIGNNRRTLGLNTWADRCSFGSEQLLFCAVPRDLPIGAGMAPEVAAGSTDDIYKIDLKTGLKTTLPLGADYRIKNLNFDSVNNKLYFTDRVQNGIFEIKL